MFGATPYSCREPGTRSFNMVYHDSHLVYLRGRRPHCGIEQSCITAPLQFRPTSQKPIMPSTALPFASLQRMEVCVIQHHTMMHMLLPAWIGNTEHRPVRTTSLFAGARLAETSCLRALPFNLAPVPSCSQVRPQFLPWQPSLCSISLSLQSGVNHNTMGC